MPLQSNNPSFPNPPVVLHKPPCCLQPSCSAWWLLGHIPSSQHPCLASPALCFSPLSKKGCSLSLPPRRRMLFPVSERESSLTPAPSPSKCLLQLFQLLGVTQSLDQLLLFSSTTERNNLRLKEIKSSNETLSLLQITFWKLSRWGSGKTSPLCSRMISVLTERPAVLLTTLFF